MGFFQGIGQGISNAVQWTGDTAKSVGTSVAHGADVAWDYTADVAATGGILVTQSLPAMVGGGDDAPMRPQVGKSAGYPGKWAPCESIPKQITVKVPFQRGAQGAAPVANAQPGVSSTLQTPASSFLYLDVGRWGGTGSGAKRDFGIVCGRTAALCAFAQGSGGSYTAFPAALATLTDGPQDEIGPINKLLGLLGGSPLGAPKVRRYLTAKAALPPGVGQLSQRVYVIVGDMHLPVTTGLIGDGAQPPEQQDLRGKRVGRTRRTDAFKDLGVMSDSDASLWHERYVGGEIFKEAGPDLTSFAGMLAKAKGNIGAELWLMQLGDMFDLWLGFDRFFKSDPPKSSGRPGNDGRMFLEDMTVPPPAPPPMMPLGPIPVSAAPVVAGAPLADVSASTVTTAKDFVDTWINRTVYKTAQSANVRDFLQFDADASKFLHGNHDNYLGTYAPPDLQKLRGGQGVLPYEHHDARALFYACHGHQWDKFNRDGAVGGLATTQTAFWTPKIRNIEPDDREVSLVGSAGLYRSGQKPFNIFAMGHTHTAILTEIVIEMEPEPAPTPPPDYAPIGP